MSNWIFLTIYTFVWSIAHHCLWLLSIEEQFSVVSCATFCNPRAIHTLLFMSVVIPARRNLGVTGTCTLFLNNLTISYTQIISI